MLAFKVVHLSYCVLYFVPFYSDPNTSRTANNTFPSGVPITRFRYTSEAAPSLRTVVIKQAASKQSVAIPERGEIVRYYTKYYDSIQ